MTGCGVGGVGRGGVGGGVGKGGGEGGGGVVGEKPFWPFLFVGWEGSSTEIDYRKKGTLVGWQPVDVPAVIPQSFS